MANNKLYYIPEWKTVATVSNPDSSFKKIYPKTGDDYWYIVDDQGYEKQIGISLYPKNGLVLTPSSPSSIYSNQLDIVLGAGLTFSSNAQGSSINVYGVTANSFKSTNSYSNGYVLSATGGGQFTWIPFTVPGISGTTNSIPKFNSSSTIGNSIMMDNTDKISIGTTPSYATGVSFSVQGGVYISGTLYLRDNTDTYLNYSSNSLNLITSQDLNINRSTYSIVKYEFDSINSQTYSLMNSSVILTDDGSSKNLYIRRVSNVEFGLTSSTMSFSILSNTSGSFKLKDSSEGLYKVLTSDSDGTTTWKYLSSNNGITISGYDINANISGYGLTFSNKYLNLDYGIFGSTLTYSSGVVNLKNLGITAGSYGSSASNVSITLDVYGRITNISTYSISTSNNSGYILTHNDKNISATAANTDGSTASYTTISQTPVQGSYVSVFIGGQEQLVGNGTTNSSCYFGTHSTIPKGFSSSNAIQAGDYLYWNPSISGFNLVNGQRISIHYLVSV